MKKEDVYARMMHTPDDPVRAELRAALRDAWKQLMPLHRALIDSASAEYSVNVAPVSGPNHLLRLLQEDEFFGWLKPLTSLIVDIDSMSRTDFDRASVDAMVARIERLFGHDADAEFASRYIPVLQRDVDVAIAHAAIRQILRRLLPAE
jgi:NAD(P)-dependent dehydrogenase (short-subunit alcohol dehydrogenase family)